MFARKLRAILLGFFKLLPLFFVGVYFIACSESDRIVAIPSPSASPTFQPATPSATATVGLTPIVPSITPSAAATATPTILPSSTPTPSITPTPTLDPFNTFVEETPQSVEAGGVKVEIFPSDDYFDLLIRITRDNIVIQESSINPVVFDEEDRTPDGDYPPIFGVQVVSVADLDLDGEPEIVLDTTLRGTNCCTWFVVLYFDVDEQQYDHTIPIVTHWGFSPRLVDIDQGGKPEFVTRNEAFNYLVGGDSFTSLVSPLQIFRYENEAFLDVTYQYPELVEQDAALLLAAVRGEDVELSELYREIILEGSEFWVETISGLEFFALRSYMADMITLGRGLEGCQNVQAYFEGNSDRWSGVLDSYGGNLCPVFMEEVAAALEGKVVDS